jgi:hypothetical protein
MSLRLAAPPLAGAVCLSLLSVASAQCPNGPSFGPPLSGPDTLSSVSRVAHADFDGDGDEDLVYRAAPGLELRRNDGAAGFTPVLGVSGLGNSSIFDYAIADLDRDGRPDLVVTVNTNVGTTLPHEVRVQTLHNAGPSGGFVTFTPGIDVLLVPGGVGLPATSVTCGDVDGDGIVDIVVATSGTTWVLRGDGSHGVPTGGFLAPVVIPTAIGNLSMIALADMNRDGAVDIVELGYAEIRVIEGQLGASGQPLGTFGPSHSTAITASPKPSLILRDFDADGWLDVALGYHDDVRVLRGLPGFAFAAPALFSLAGASPEQPFAGDFDRDGRCDIAVPCSVNYQPGPNFRVLRDPLGAAQWTTYQMDAGYPESGVALDYDRDGLLDVAIGKISQRVTTAAGQCAVLAAPGIAVVVPNGGENWVAGTQHTIQWTAQTLVASFDVDASFDDGATWVSIARTVTGTSFSWWVPEPSTNRARVRVLPTDLPVFADQSNGRFTISGAGLAAAVPIGVGCGLPTPIADATVPHLGGTTALELSGASANVHAAWWLSVPSSAPLPLGLPGCFAYLDPAALTLLAFATTNASGRFDVGVPVPAASALQGVAVAVQATAFPPAGAFALQVSNAMVLTLGF